MLEALMKIDIKTLRTFMCIVECQGVTAAQQKLHRSPSVISGHLKYLEQTLDLVLCERGCSGFSLTLEGQAVYQACLKFVEAAGNFQHELYTIRQESDKKGGIIRLSMADQLPNFFYQRLQATINKMYGNNPNLHFLIKVQSPEEMTESLFNNQIDLGIGYFSNFPLLLDYQYAFDERQVVCCGQLHPLFSRMEDIELKELETDFIWIKRGYQIAHTLQKMQPSQFGATAFHMEATAQLILTGNYLGYLPYTLAKRYIAKKEMRIIADDFASYQVKIHWAYRPKIKSPVREFLKSMQKGLVNRVF